ncbi:hypothetical protein SBA2_430019 [Acidobacteriia bacterium SbA2]|nr:hypothetical protein SBA2_430019 [Acidobacteriia bacterium SbA2]
MQDSSYCPGLTPCARFCRPCPRRRRASSAAPSPKQTALLLEGVGVGLALPGSLGDGKPSPYKQVKERCRFHCFRVPVSRRACATALKTNQSDFPRYARNYKWGGFSAACRGQRTTAIQDATRSPVVS